MIMSKEEKFKYNIENIKASLEVEGMIVTDEDIEIIKKYANKEISFEELIEMIIREFANK